MRTRRFRYLVLATAALAALVVIGCDFTPRMSDLQRMEAFIEGANADPRDAAAMRDHFHPGVSERPGMDANYWELSFFAFGDRPFSLKDLVAGGAVDGLPGDTSFSGMITSESTSEEGKPITITFAADPETPADAFDQTNRLIRAISIPDPGGDLIQSIR